MCQLSRNKAEIPYGTLLRPPPKIGRGRGCIITGYNEDAVSPHRWSCPDTGSRGTAPCHILEKLSVQFATWSESIKRIIIQD